MKKLRLLFIVCAIFLLPQAALAATADNAAVHTVSVQGSAALAAAPDQASIAIGVTSNAATAAEAQQKNAAIATAIRDSLKEKGISTSDIQTQNYSFYPVYSEEKNHGNDIIGYTVDNTVSVTINDVKAVGDIIDTAIACGANKINSIDFTVKNTDQIQQNAIKAAVRDARKKADLLASAAGKHIINVLSIQENGTRIESRQFGQMLLNKAAADSTPIEGGNVNVSASVQIEFIMD